MASRILYWRRKVFVDIVDLGDENEVQVGALRIGVREMRHADGLGAGFDHLAHLAVHLLHLSPAHTAFQGVDHDAEVHHILTHEGVAEAAFFPGLHHAKRRQGEGVVFVADGGHFVCYQAGEIPLAIGGAQQQAALHGRVAQGAQHAVGWRVLEMVGAHGHVRLFGVGEAEHGGDSRTRPA